MLTERRLLFAYKGEPLFDLARADIAGVGDRRRTLTVSADHGEEIVFSDVPGRERDRFLAHFEDRASSGP